MKQVPEQVLVYVAEGLILERQKAKEKTKRLIAKAILQECGNIQAQILTQIENAIANVISSQVDASVQQQYQLYLAMKDDPQLQQQDIAIWLALQMKFGRATVPQTTCRTLAIRPRDQDEPHDDAHPKGENSVKRQKTSEYEAYVSGESSSGQDLQEELAPSTLGNQEQDDDFDFWTDSYASDDDEIPSKQVSQDIMEEVSLTIDEAKLRKMADEMLRQRCTSGDEHQYHIDQMKNFLKSDIVWESRKEILVSPHPRKTTPLVHSCQKDPEAPALSLINQDLLYLKKGNSGPEKIVLSLHKFPAIIFNDDDIEERTSRWVNKCVKKFNPYARYGVEHWKNPHAKIFYIRKQKEPGKSKEEIYSNSKIIQVIKTYWELGHEHKFITEIVARRANDCIVSITKPDYKNLNKNDIEDIYLLIMNGKCMTSNLELKVINRRLISLHQQITFLGIEEHEMFSIIHEHVHGIIYKNSKKEKRVMRHSEIHKFYDTMLNRVLEGLKSYNNDVKYGYVQKDLTKDKIEYLELFEDEIEERLKHQRQMRRWEMKSSKRREIVKRARQKSYADKRHKPLEFEVGDRVLLKVSPWKGVIRFGKKGKLALRYVGPFKILERIGLVAYRLRLPEELSSVRDTFHVLNLKKCLADANLHVPLDEIKVDKTLRFVEEPVEIMDREIKKLKRRKIALVKVRWNSKRGPEFTWEHKD
ncbi:hypothetical protein Tco_0104134 [Tanacetum coccineum]